MLTLTPNKDHLAITALTEAFLSSGGKIKTVGGFTEVASKRPAKYAPPKKKPEPKVSKKLAFWPNCESCRRILKMASIKHEDFAELIGVHKNTLSGYLRGAYPPPRDVAERIEATIERLIGIKPGTI